MNRTRIGIARVALLVGALVAAGGSPTPAPAQHIVAREATINLQVAREVRDQLREAGLRVTMTRNTDRTLRPSRRTGLANSRKVDAFISIHHNASSNRSARGAIVFHSIRPDGSRALGTLIGDAFRQEFPKRPARAATRRGCCGDYYYQLRWASMPAVLVEGAFVSHPGEGRRLAASPRFRGRIASSIVEGILAYQRTLTQRPLRARDPGTVLPGTHLPPAEVNARAQGAHRVRVRWIAQEVVPATSRIYRDGVLLGERTAEPGAPGAFRDRWAAPGQTYTYEVRTTQEVPAGVFLESIGVQASARTPAMSVVLDPGHGGRDPGAIYRYH